MNISSMIDDDQSHKIRKIVGFSESQIVNHFENTYSPFDVDFTKFSGGGVIQYNCDSVNKAYHHYRLGFIKAAQIANKLLQEATL